MDRRRGSPPPPPPPHRGRMPYDGPRMDRRRSRSPPDRFARGRSPPPQFKRSRRDDEPYYGRFNRGGEDMMRGPPRGPPRGYPDFHDGPRDGRRPSPDRGEPLSDRSSGPLTFKQFMLKLQDDPTPEEAQLRYKEYMVEYHGGEIKAEFASTKEQARVRALYDPRSFEKALAKRNEEAAESRTKFLEDLNAGLLQPSAPGFNQGAGDLAPKGAQGAADGAAPVAVDGAAGKAEDPNVAFAPAFCWRPSRVAADLAMARRLARRLDYEKSFPDDNPLLPVRNEEAVAAQAVADVQDAQDAAAAKEEGKAVPSGSAKRFVEVEEGPVAVDTDNYPELVGRLDLLLTYLWRVHGVDYYTGYELTASEFPQRLKACRLLRGPKPEDMKQEAGTEAAEASVEVKAEESMEATDVNNAAAEAPKASAPAAQVEEEEEAAAGVEACWNRRIAEGDPLEAQCQRKKVEEELDKWIEAQVVCHADNKWGSLVSTKLFMARKFVIKHIRTKHEEKVQAQKEKILDDLYFENFKAAKQEEEQVKQEEAAHQHHQQHNTHEEGGGEEGNAMEEDDPDGARGGRGGSRGGARGGRGMGRGGRGRMPPMMPGMMMDPMALMHHMPPAMMMGPGAGMPFMPMMAAQMGMGMGMPMIPPAMLMGAMRGGRGGRGGMPAGARGGRGGRGGVSLRMDSSGMREYYDLDNPQNNRAILDYGDL